MSTQFSLLVGDNSSKIPPLLSVSEFFLARAPEVVKLHSSLKRTTLRIPNHRRRRLRSYKPYWSNPKQRKGKEATSVSRRTKRLHRLYLNQTEKRRLALTHVWHAKRFHMEDIWGMRLAGRVCDKGERAIARLGQRESLLHDRSYMDCWEISHDALGALGSLFTGTIDHVKVISGEFVGAGDIVDLESNIVCPYQCFSSASHMEIWTHPSVRLEVEALLVGGVLIIDRVRFELLGARSLEKLKTLGDFQVSLIPGKVQSISIHGITLMMSVRGRGELVDLIFPKSDISIKTWNVWLRLVGLGCSAIGVNDRHAYIGAKYLCPDFPFDFPTSKAGAKQAALITMGILKKDQSRPKHCKLSLRTAESPFFPDWDLLGIPKPLHTNLRHVVLRIPGKGVVRWNAHVYRDGGLIGFVTSVCGEQRKQAIANIALQEYTVSADVKIRNPNSNDLTSAILVDCSVPSSDSLLLGHFNVNM